MSFDAVLFDLGGVVVTWEPWRPFEEVLPADQVPALMERIGFYKWNEQVDAGRRFADAEAELCAQFPNDAEAILAYRKHYPLAITGLVPGTVAVMAELAQAGVELSALTNWSDETFPAVRERLGALNRFGEILVSGAEKVAKPDPAIYHLACERAGLDPAKTVFVDDRQVNVDAAVSIGLSGLLFTSAAKLRTDLEHLGLLAARAPVTEPIYHFALRAKLAEAERDGEYPWADRASTYSEVGFVHCSFARQVADTRQRFYADIDDSEIVLLRLDPTNLPVVVENGYPHLFAPLPLERAVQASTPA